MSKLVADNILLYLGGKDNIAELENCMTRLRVSLKDSSLLKRKELEALKEVLKVLGEDSEPQIVLGPGVADSIGGILKEELGDGYRVNAADGALMHKKEAKGIFQFFAKVFTPLVPVFAGSGLLFGIMKLFVAIFNVTETQLFNPAAIADGGSMFMAILTVLCSTFFSYLNIAVAMQSAKVMGGNPLLGLVAGGIITSVGGLNGNPMGIFNLTFLNGRGGVLAAMAAGALIAVVEKWVKSRTPNAMKVHFPSLAAITVVGITTIYVIQPVAGFVTDVITSGLLWMFNFAGPLGGAIISALYLPLVMTGMHHGLTPVHTTLIAELGYSPLFTFNSMAGGGQVGAALALLIRYRRNRNLHNAVIGGLPAGVLGIGEPLIFGVTLPLGRVFATACAGAAVGGLICGLFPGTGTMTMNVSGILGVVVNSRPGVYLLAYAATIVFGFLFTWIAGVKEENLKNFEEG